MNKYIKSPAMNMSNTVSHKKPRKPRGEGPTARLHDVRHIPIPATNSQHREHREELDTWLASMKDELGGSGNVTKGYSHPQRRKITLPHVSILGNETKWNTILMLWNSEAGDFDRYQDRREIK